MEISTGNTTPAPTGAISLHHNLRKEVLYKIKNDRTHLFGRSHVVCVQPKVFF